MGIRQQLAQLLTSLTDQSGKPLAQVARDLGYSRQRLYQLRTADRSAAPEAIEEAITKLGYEITVSVKEQGEQS